MEKLRNWYLITILVLAAMLRFIWLDRFPVAISGDELAYPITTMLSFLGSTVLSWNPFSVFLFQYPPGVFPQAELPYFIAYLFSGSLFLVRLPYAVLSVGIVCLLYLLTKHLLGERTALFTAFLAALNPWFIVMGRTGYEMTPAMFFYLLGMYLLLRAKNSIFFIASFLCFVSGFYSYIGTKLLFVPLIVMTCLYAYYCQKEKLGKIFYVTISISAVVFVIFFVTMLRLQEGSRINEIFLPNNSQVSQRVLELRQQSIPSPLDSIVNNKITAYGQIVSEKLLASFSPTYLFINGDSFYGLNNYGLFHLLDILFMLIGVSIIFIKKKSVTLFLLGAVLLGAIPQILHKNNDMFTPHITMIFPFLLIFAGSGIDGLISMFHSKYRYVLMGSIIFCYLLLAGKFTHVYFYQLPLSGQSDLPLRTLASYINRVQSRDTNIVIYTNRKEDVYKKYLFYSQRITKETLPQVDTSLIEKKYQIDSLTFVSCDNKQTPAANTITIVMAQCGTGETEKEFVKIAYLSDGGEVYRIFNDTLCDKKLLTPYPQQISLNQFSVEKLSDTAFCTSYITK